MGMSTLGIKTGVGTYFRLGEKVMNGLECCAKNNALSCGNCPYCFLKDEEKEDVTKCTSALNSDALEYIRDIYKVKANGTSEVIETLDNNYCQACCSPVIGGDNFCHECGRELIWRD